MHFNKGNSYFKTKINDIYLIIDKFSPDFLSLSEANYDVNSNTKIPGYGIESNHLNINNYIARSIVIIKESLSYTRCYEFENINISSIWLKINLSRNNYIYACSYYRQWQLPNNCNTPNSNTKSGQIKIPKIKRKRRLLQVLTLSACQ